MAKVKAAVSEDTPRALVKKLNRLKRAFQKYVFGPCFHREHWGPGEGYVQNCDFGDPSDGLFCVVDVTRVSKTDDRLPEDFERALRRIQEMYALNIARFAHKGTMTQLFVSITIDKPLSEERPTPLLELDPIWVEGTAGFWRSLLDWILSFGPHRSYLNRFHATLSSL